MRIRTLSHQIAQPGYLLGITVENDLCNPPFAAGKDETARKRAKTSRLGNLPSPTLGLGPLLPLLLLQPRHASFTYLRIPRIKGLQLLRSDDGGDFHLGRLGLLRCALRFRFIGICLRCWAWGAGLPVCCADEHGG